MITLLSVIVVLLLGIRLYQLLVEENFTSSGAPYARLGDSYNSQLFSPCLAKRCAGGPYMYSSNPYLQSVCQGVTNEEIGKVACGTGFHGKPTRFDYSGLGEASKSRITQCADKLQHGAWGNALCDASSPTSICEL